MKTEDGYIVHECINGDKSAFAILIDKYKAAVFAIAYDKLHNFHDAQDVAQEVFIKAFQKLSTLKNYDKFAVWIHSITNNLCKNYIRSQSRRPDSEFLEDQKESAIDSNSMRTFKDDIENEMINDALNSLPEIYRQVLTLHYLGGMKDSEIAEFLGMSHTNVRQRLMKARTQLKEEMISMMDRTFEEQKLQAGFTFRVVEIVKRIKIHPITQTKNLPWGLSLATGLIFTILSLNSHLNQIVMLDSLGGSFLPSESKVLKVGEIPMDMTNISKVTFLSSQQGNGNSSDKSLNQNAFFMAPKADGKWVKKADMPTERCQMGAVTIGGKIYAVGGLKVVNGNFIQLPTVEEYDPIDDKWTEKANIPLARFLNYSVCEVNGMIYAIGGGGGLPNVDAYDPIKDRWTKKADLPTPRTHMSSAVVNGKIYAISGLLPNMKIVPTVEEYDPVNDVWTKKADMPDPRESASAVTVNNKIYVVGGDFTDDPNAWGVGMAKVLEYDPATDTWSKKSDMPTPRTAAAAVVVDNKIYVICGFSGGANAIFFPTVEIYDPINDTWTKGVDMAVAKTFPACSAVNGKIYVIGGYSGGVAMSDVEEYDTGFRPSQAIDPKGKLPDKWGKIKAK
jgi:RNA polymerase sigma factor (sigma-70 family)